MNSRGVVRVGLAVTVIVVLAISIVHAARTTVAPSTTTPTTTPVSCPTATVTVSGASALSAALESATAGEVIDLRPGSYRGNFVIATSGTASSPIHICGPRSAVLDGGTRQSGYTLHISHAAFVNVSGLSIRGGQKGVVVDASQNVTLNALDVGDVGDEGIHLRDHSSFDLVENCVVHDTGLLHPYFGEGFYVGTARHNWDHHVPDTSNHNELRDDVSFNTTAEGVDIKEGTSYGLLDGGHFDGTLESAVVAVINVKGTHWTIRGATVLHGPTYAIATHVITPGSGSFNVISHNVLSVSGAGPDIWFAQPISTQNVATCDNRTTSGSPASTSVPCRSVNAG